MHIKGTEIIKSVRKIIRTFHLRLGPPPSISRLIGKSWDKYARLKAVGFGFVYLKKSNLGGGITSVFLWRACIVNAGTFLTLGAEGSNNNIVIIMFVLQNLEIS